MALLAGRTDTSITRCPALSHVPGASAACSRSHAIAASPAAGSAPRTCNAIPAGLSSTHTPGARPAASAARARTRVHGGLLRRREGEGVVGRVLQAVAPHHAHVGG